MTLESFTVFQLFFITLLMEAELIFVLLLCWFVWVDTSTMVVAIYDENTDWQSQVIPQKIDPENEW